MSFSSRVSQIAFGLILFSTVLAVSADIGPVTDDIAVKKDITYKTGDSLTDYEKERCKLDVYAPAKTPADGATVIVWFYGGGLETGKKEDGIPFGSSWAKQGFIVVVPNYRLSPKATFPAYLDDAAASIAWTFANAKDLGGNLKKIFITGHSAGGYLAAQIAADPKYLAAYKLKPSDLAGTMPIAGQVFTHFTIRKERGVPNPTTTPIIDAEAPVNHVSKETIPTLLIVGDNDWPARLEETQYMVALAKHLKAPDIEMKVIADRNHGTIMGKMSNPTDPGWQAMLEFMKNH